VYFCSIFSEPGILSTFSFKLLEVYIIGMITALLVSLIIFPLFATFDIENRFNYSLSKLQEMHVLIIQAFLSPNKMGARMILTKVTMIENMVRKTLGPIQTRIDEARFEPSRYLQRIFNRKHRHIIDLTIHGELFFFLTKNLFIVRFFRTRRFHHFIDISCMFTSIDG
jgi:hypothetical protein